MMKNHYRKNFAANSIILVIAAVSFLFYSFSTGITGKTLKNGTGCICHGENSSSNVNVVISGPDTLLVNQTASFTVTISGGPLVRGGTNIAASLGSLTPANSDLQIMDTELTHIIPKQPVSGSVTFEFNYTAPADPGNQTLYANGNSVDFTGTFLNDQWNFAANKNIIVLSVVPVELTQFTYDLNGSSVNLKWTTATETNNNGFEIQRLDKNIKSSDWRSIGFVKGMGNSTEFTHYSFTDRNLTTGLYSYRLKQIDFNGTSSYYDLKEELEIINISTYSLEQNYPNPFNPSTTINYSIPASGFIELKIHNVLGSEIASLVNDYKEPGSYSVKFNATDLSSGIYYYSINVLDPMNNEVRYSSVMKMILIK